MLHLVGFLSSRFTHHARSQEHKAYVIFTSYLHIIQPWRRTQKIILQLIVSLKTGVVNSGHTYVLGDNCLSIGTLRTYSPNDVTVTVKSLQAVLLEAYKFRQNRPKESSIYTGLFKMIVVVLTPCHIQYTSNRSMFLLFNRITFHVFVT